MAFSIKQVKAKLQEYGVPAENLDTAAEYFCSAHKTDLDAIKEERDTYKTDAETLAKVQKELDDLKAAGDGGLQKQLDELQKKYDDDAAAHKTELDTLRQQLSDRDSRDALAKAISSYNEGKGIKFTSNGARTSFESAWAAKKVPLKDGALDGDAFKVFVTDYQKTDPDTFASDKPPARFAAPVGVGGKPDDVPGNVRMAKAMGAAKAETMKASDDVFSKYT